jgi:dihydropyrimidinase
MRIQGGKILTPAGPVAADVILEGERIAAVVEPGAGPSGSGSFDADGRWVLPGAVDAHTHFGMPLGNGLTSLGWAESAAAALLGGTTTVVDFANPGRGEPLPAVLQRWRDMADGTVLCDYGLHVTVTDTSPERLAEIPAVMALGAPTFKGFLAYKGRLMLDPGQMGALMAAVGKSGAMLLVHAEDGEVNAAAEEALATAGRTAPRHHPLAHPVDSEVAAVEQALQLALTHACPLLVVHMSTAGALDALRNARRRSPGAPLLGEVCIHHLFADAGLYEAGDDRALAAICSPPLRDAAHGAALLAGLADGALDLLSTDHCEFRLADKRAAAAGGFTRVPNGCGGVGERLVFSFSRAVAAGPLTPFQWQEACCRLPALHMGLGGRKGSLAPGLDADVVVFDPDAAHAWRPAPGSDPEGSIWVGQRVTGRVTDVWLRGRRVVSGGALSDDQPGGRYLARRLPLSSEGS